MVMEAAWKRIIGELRVAHSHDFESKLLPYLRVLWPTLIKPTGLQELDRFGVDMCTADAPANHEVIVQAKGFRIEESLTENQVNNQILPSIQKFRNSPVSCKKYVLIHNRYCKDQELRERIFLELQSLRDSGSAIETEFWDLNNLVAELRDKLDQLIRNKLRDRSRQVAIDHHKFFFGDSILPRVPLRTYEWDPVSAMPTQQNRGNFTDDSASQVIASPRSTRYSLLTGSFGIGKTTSIIGATDSGQRNVIYVRAPDIQRSAGSQGTNFLMRNIGSSLNLLEDLPPDSSEVISSTLGVLLGRILRQADDSFVLVIDGLDEHPFYSTVNGLQWLSNELAELRCPVVLATRLEHLDHLMGNYRVSLEELSKKGGANRAVRVVELGQWGSSHALDFLNLIRQQVDENERQRINLLAERIIDSSDPNFVTLISHPLFLNMTLDLFMYGLTDLIVDQNELMNLWIIKKIERDISVPRLRLEGSIDIDRYIHGMIATMQKIAADSVISSGSARAYVDEFDLEPALETARKSTGLAELDSASFITTSLFVPVNGAHPARPKIRFFHRRIQEYLAA